ncbi:hypothetical protein EVAR_66387_1 [Eumeta japonica]|uniref:Uncharacterized protein n=1 Tax=Eumeta variegata TaxID=151549 RepID=A0A4C1ZJI4_EUMVA|nr:hypothetical protein EVAR_66387_1 [Eumeta japonica]
MRAPAQMREPREQITRNECKTAPQKWTGSTGEISHSIEYGRDVATSAVDFRPVNEIPVANFPLPMLCQPNPPSLDTLLPTEKQATHCVRELVDLQAADAALGI